MVTEVFFEGDRLITRQSTQTAAAVQALNDTATGRTLTQLDPPGAPGADRIRVQFWVDRDRTLRITVEDLLTNVTICDQQAVVQLS